MLNYIYQLTMEREDTYTSSINNPRLYVAMHLNPPP